jgi:carbon monoxide dehydrogenase subunit G
MEIEQSFCVPFAMDSVWHCFQDIEGIVGCLPGAALTAPPDDGKLKLSMTVKLGPIVAAFAGDGEIVFDDALRQGKVSGSGNDRKSGSRVKGEAVFSLHDAGQTAPEGAPSTRVDVRVDYTIAGSLAQFSRGGIVRELAERLTSAFSDKLKQKLETEHASPATDATAANVDPPPPAPSHAAPLDLGGLFWPMLLGRLKRLFGISPKP